VTATASGSEADPYAAIGVPQAGFRNAAPLPEGVKTQTRRVVDNLKLALARAGSSLAEVVFARVYLTEFERDYAAMNDVCRGYFAVGRLLARTCIGVPGLARGALVEIDRLARRSTS
jgi:2-iminobutanoate/2-iminopropanoate deaminase